MTQPPPSFVKRIRHGDQAWTFKKLLQHNPHTKGWVILAEDTTGMIVVLKLIPVKDGTHELAMMKRCEGFTPKLYTSFDLKLDDIQYTCLVMEFCPDGDLYGVLQKGCLTEEEARHLFRRVLELFLKLHNKHIIHRDIKPENIMLTDKGLLAIDLAFAQQFNDGEGDDGSRCGTVPYAAPEVLNDVQCSEKSRDMWALGIVLCAMLTNDFPFHCGEQALYKDTEKDTESLQKYLTCFFSVKEVDITDGTKEFLLRLLDPNPKTRIDIETALQHEWFQHECTRPMMGDKQPSLCPMECPNTPENPDFLQLYESNQYESNHLTPGGRDNVLYAFERNTPDLPNKKQKQARVERANFTVS